MRTIKYRQPVFNPDGSFKEYHYWGIIDLIGEGVKQWVSPITAKYYIDVKITNPADGEQFTGLKDKNGKDIYEGDVIRNSRGDWGVIVWKAPFFETTVSENQSSLYTREYYEESEIIGNIHENPELLQL